MFSQAGVTYRRPREYVVALDLVSPWTGERTVQRAEANNVLLSTQCSCRGARKSQQAPLTRSFHYERASPNGAEASSASQSRSHYAAPIC